LKARKKEDKVILTNTQQLFLRFQRDRKYWTSKNAKLNIEAGFAYRISGINMIKKPLKVVKLIS